jgi:hypothetical protein
LKDDSFASMRERRRAGSGTVVTALAVAGVCLGGLAAALLALLLSVFTQGSECAASPSGSIALGPPGTGQVVGATEYGGPGDPSSGTVGAADVSLLQYPDSYAELGGTSFQTATAMGGLPYMTPLRVTWANHSAIAYKRDIGLGGPPIDGLPRVIDLWWQLAGRLGIPYERGLWSGPVRVERAPDSGSGALLGQTAGDTATIVASQTAAADPAGCAGGSLGGLPVVPGSRAQLLPNGLAAAPADAPRAVKEIIAAGNQIVGKPYVYGGAHGLPLSEIAPDYDCSSSVEHLLYGGGLLPVTYGGASSELESFGQPGAGNWVTVYADADHVFVYVAGLRWDTHNAAGRADGSTGIGWHPLIRGSDGFLARHPQGL